MASSSKFCSLSYCWIVHSLKEFKSWILAFLGESSLVFALPTLTPLKMSKPCKLFRIILSLSFLTGSFSYLSRGKVFNDSTAKSISVSKLLETSRYYTCCRLDISIGNCLSLLSDRISDFKFGNCASISMYGTKSVRCLNQHVSIR